MENLLLLFTKDGLQWQINKASTTIEEEAFFVNEEENNPTFIEKKLEDVLQRKSWNEIRVLSAFNHFSLMPEGFSIHELGQQIISYNADIIILFQKIFTI